MGRCTYPKKNGRPIDKRDKRQRKKALRKRKNHTKGFWSYVRGEW